jgi:hypothetical protein
MKCFVVTHSHRYGVNTHFIFSEDMPDVIDLAISDILRYEPHAPDEHIDISYLPYVLSKHLDMSAMLSDCEFRIEPLCTIVNLASPEERKRYKDNRSLMEMDILSKYHLRD